MIGGIYSTHLEEIAHVPEDTPLPPENPVAEVTGEEPREVTAGEENPPTLESLQEELRQLVTDADRERIRQEAIEQLRVEFEQERQRQAQELAQRQQAERLANSFADTVKDIRTNLMQTRPDDFTDEEFEKLIAQPLQRYNTQGLQSASVQVLGRLRDAALETLPADKRDEFAKKAQGKPLNEWLTTYAELLAPETSTVKATKKELEAAIKAAEMRGFQRGQQTKAAPPVVGADDKPLGGTIDRTSISGIAKAKAAGLIDDAEFNKLFKQLRDGSV